MKRRLVIHVDVTDDFTQAPLDNDPMAVAAEALAQSLTVTNIAHASWDD